MRYYMQQKVRRTGGKKKPCAPSGKGSTETHRGGSRFSVQSCHHSEKKHFEGQNADCEKCSGKLTETGGNSDPVKPGCFAVPFILLIKFYRRFISPLFPPCCRFTPTCSMYGIQAIGIHGPVKGLLLTVWRVLRCNPFIKGGYDPVPPKGRWRPLNSDKEESL